MDQKNTTKSFKKDTNKQPNLAQASLMPSFAFFNVNKTMIKIVFDDIIYIESLRDYIQIHTKQEEDILTKLEIGKIEHKLPDTFLRVHRSFIVNLQHIKGYNAKTLILEKDILPIGNAYKDNLLDHFKAFIWS